MPMENFIIQFLICNLLIIVILGIVLATKYLFRKTLSARMQYNLWIFFLALLAVPFLPIHSSLPFFWGLGKFQKLSSKTVDMAAEMTLPSDTTNWINDFSLSISRQTSSGLCIFLYAVWFIGIFFMIRFMFKSWMGLKRIRQSALPLQNETVRNLYHDCRKEMNINRDIPVYSTAFLHSPILTGVFKPTIYLPIHLLSDDNASNLRYMLLHELVHYKYKDNLINYMMNLANTFYWFNPFIWYALKQMRNDREIACDTSVLQMLEEKEYFQYGNTLIDFAEKISFSSFPFATGISGNMIQIRQRILNIASYKKPSVKQKILSLLVFMIAAVLLFNCIPALTTYASDENRYDWNTASESIAYVDLSDHFNDYNGSFVLYDLENDCWTVYNKEMVTLRVSPDSTYKIYDALFGLKSGVISPENSQMIWNGEIWPFEEWNQNQTLSSAMTNSVNWYFENIDRTLGFDAVENYINQISYGNRNIGENFPSYWLESSLKISPVEQVELLKGFYNNSFGFAPENIAAVKKAILLSSSQRCSLYGKTGTGRVNDQDINGWFIGYVETNGHTWFFATNIQADQNATGSKASEITLGILSELKILD